MLLGLVPVQTAPQMEKLEEFADVSFYRSACIGTGKFGGWVYQGKFKGIRDIAVKRVSKRLAFVESNDFVKADGHSNIIRHYSTEEEDVEFM